MSLYAFVKFLHKEPSLPVRFQYNVIDFNIIMLPNLHVIDIQYARSSLLTMLVIYTPIISVLCQFIYVK